MRRERVVWLLAALGLVLLGWWLQANTEWADVEVPRAISGDARGNPMYASEQLLRSLGMQVAHHEELQQLPPPGARLLLLSNEWTLLAGRSAALRRWVEQDGGQLVLVERTDWRDSPLSDWLPVRSLNVPDRDRDDAASARPNPPNRQPVKAGVPAAPQQEGALMDSEPALWDGVRQLRICGVEGSHSIAESRDGSSSSWTMRRGGVTVALRVPVGRGSVTVVNLWTGMLWNGNLLGCDNAQLFAAAMQARQGATAWIYVAERREAVVPWLWERGWITLLAALLALAAALWRGALRFGPPMATPPRLRRSIGEQVRGLGAWLRREGREALIEAQQRALDEAAARQLPGWRRLAGRARAEAIARATDLPADDLAEALRSTDCPRPMLTARLQLLETARRRLLPQPPQGTPSQGPTT